MVGLPGTAAIRAKPRNHLAPPNGVPPLRATSSGSPSTARRRIPARHVARRFPTARRSGRRRRIEIDYFDDLCNLVQQGRNHLVEIALRCLRTWPQTREVLLGPAGVHSLFVTSLIPSRSSSTANQ